MKLERLLSRRFLNWLLQDKPAKNNLLSNMDCVEKIIQPCDVLLIEGRSKVAEVIKVITRSAWSHAAIYVGNLEHIHHPDTRNLLSQHIRNAQHQQYVIEGILGQGFIISPLSIYKNAHIRICRPKNISDIDKQQVLTFAIKSLGKKYSSRHIFDLARFLLPWRFLPSRWRSMLFKYEPGSVTDEICSSMIAQAFDFVNFPILPLAQKKNDKNIEFIKRNPLLCTPSDFDYSPFFEIIKYPLLDNFSNDYSNIPWNHNITSNGD